MLINKKKGGKLSKKQHRAESLPFSGGKTKKLPRYPPGDCVHCGTSLTSWNPLNICFRCQGMGLKREPREPIGVKKEVRR